MVDQKEPQAAVEQAIELVLPVPPAPFPYLWFSGQQYPWERAAVHVTMVGWPAVNAVFEGIRGYWNAERGELYIFRLAEHMRRMDLSMKLQRMTPKFSAADLSDALLALARANDARGDIYLQPLAFMAGARSGSGAIQDTSPDIMITMRPSPSDLLGGRALSAGVSSWTRISDDTLPPRIKALPNYANSRLAGNEAQRHGYDAPIFLNRRGTVAESSGSCLVIVRDGVVITPPVTASILESITRDAVLTLCADALELAVEEREIDRTELYSADEAFLCGTAMEVAPLTRVDGYQIGSGEPGPTTRRIERLFHDVVRGIDGRFAHWRTLV